MNNSIRHGQASAISVIFNEDNGIITCEYTDNGKGFDMKNLRDKSGLGMKNIESRIMFLEGSMKIDSAVNKGVNVVFNF